MRLLLLALFFLAQDKPPQVCSLSGSVTNNATGAPLNKVELIAEAIDSHGNPPASTLVDAKGNFTMIDLPAGKYRLKAIRNGFLDSYYGARRPEGKGTIITLDAGQELRDLQVKMFPFGVIAGIVRDADGEPMAGAHIKVLRQTYEDDGRRKIGEETDSVTDDLGQYRIADLPPGKYYVRAERHSQEQYGSNMPVDHSAKAAEPPAVLLPTIYPGTIDPTTARTVEVASGAPVGGVDISLVRSRVYRVKVRPSAAAGLDVYNAWLDAAPGFEQLAPRLRGRRKDGEADFEIDGVPPGAYILYADGGKPSKKEAPGTFTFNFYQRQYLARAPLTVTGDVEGVRIAIGAGNDVTGSIRTEAGEKLESTRYVIGFSQATGETVQAAVQEDLTFATGLYPGRYQITVQHLRSNLVIQSIRSDGVDIFAEGLNITEGVTPTVEIVLAPEGGQVDGVVLDKDDKPAAGATLLLVAEPKLRARRDAFQEATADQYGRYHFEGIRAGDYKLFAWDDLEQNSWFDPDFLKEIEGRGEPVTVAAKGHGSVSLHLLTK
jgi:hypothetical protein